MPKHRHLHLGPTPAELIALIQADNERKIAEADAALARQFKEFALRSCAGPQPK